MVEDIFGNRLLLIDDEAPFGRLVRRVAEEAGFEVIVTDDPDEFTRAARSWGPTVILLDLRMPGTDGVQLLRTLAADKCAAHLVLTSGADAKTLDSAMQLGRGRGLKMSGMLRKPVRIETLRRLLAGFRPVSKEVLVDDLAEAIAADQLFLEYQPKFDCRRGRIAGVEALVRWRHPRHGVIRPDQFVTLAEQSALIHRLTDWVVAAAARQAADWRAKRLSLDVAVNISARDVEDIALPERLHRHCAEAGIEPDSVILELTETGAMRQAMLMMDVLTRLRLRGFNLSIDDFGTGYSSLVQLQRMPFSEVKIDSSFVMPMMSNDGCRVIVEIIIDLARKLELKSVAEGVEDEATFKALVELGCDAVQGYYFSRPVAADRIAILARDAAGKARLAGQEAPANLGAKTRGATPPERDRARAAQDCG